VYLSVYYTRKQVLAATIHDLVLVLGRDGTDFLNAFPLDQDVINLDFTFVDEGYLLDERGLGHGG
jgi:hypothetical protein